MIVEDFRLPHARWPRLQLFEFTDLPGLPRPIRRWLGDYLRGIVTLTRLFAPAGPRIAALLQSAGTDQVVDLCSGAGGPWPALAPGVEASLGRPVHVHLTDLHPDGEAWAWLEASAARGVTGHPGAVRADHVPGDLPGVRTLFDGLHHLPPASARAVLADASRHGVPILAAEAVERSALGLLGVLSSPLLVWLVTPFLRPVTMSRLLFTYVVPVVPLLVLFDGVVSVLRCYRPEELLALAAGLPGDLEWRVDRARPWGPAATFLTGTPRQR
ncbi:MAG: hypothetical protein H6Q88_316 [Anaeromyxobacteraceae bacterium]|nr:hypothetical protein [Anaeromyxobacteraceae bacterium]